MPSIKITGSQLKRLILEVSKSEPKIDLKNPDFWYQDAVNPVFVKLSNWLDANIKKKRGTIEFEEEWPYPVSPEAIDEYDVGSTYFEIKMQVQEFPFEEDHVGWNLEGGAGDFGHANGIEFELHLRPDIEVNNQLMSAIKVDLLDTLAHEIHHMTQFGALQRLNCPIYLNTTSDNDFDYFKQCDEKPAFVIGFRARAYQTGVSTKQVMETYLQNYVKVGRITKKQAEEILRDWLDYEF